MIALASQKATSGDVMGAAPDMKYPKTCPKNTVPNSIDSAMMPDARGALRRFAEANRHGMPLADLAWTRLTRWREMLAQVFENRDDVASATTFLDIRSLVQASAQEQGLLGLGAL